MAGTINRSDLAKQLVPGLNKVVGLNYSEVIGEHRDLFEMVKSDRAFEEEQNMTTLGSAPVKAEGQGVEYDTMRETWTARYTMETIALAFAISEEAMEDNLYQDQSVRYAKHLGRALAETKETKGANVFNNAFNAAFVGGDGKSLIATDHPTLSGDQSNEASSDISEAALETAVIAVSKFKDERDLFVGAKAQSLHIPVDLQFVVERILKSNLSITALQNVAGTENVSNSNATNALRSRGHFAKGVFTNLRFTDPGAWFIRTNCPDGTKMFTRKALTTKMEGDFESGNMRFKARERYAFGWSDWRQWYGST